MEKCFIDKKDHKVMEKITQLYHFANQLNKIVKEEGCDIWMTETALNKIREIEV